MSKANEPAYPQPPSIFSEEVLAKVQRMYGKTIDIINPQYTGVTQRDKLAMEIYARLLVGNDYGATADHKSELADYSLRAADIFFEQLNK